MRTISGALGKCKDGDDPDDCQATVPVHSAPNPWMVAGLFGDPGAMIPYGDDLWLTPFLYIDGGR